MGTHFLDIKGKLADGEAILQEYYNDLRDAQQKGDSAEIKKSERRIEEQENYLAGCAVKRWIQMYDDLPPSGSQPQAGGCLADHLGERSVRIREVESLQVHHT